MQYKVLYTYIKSFYCIKTFKKGKINKNKYCEKINKVLQQIAVMGQ